MVPTGSFGKHFKAKATRDQIDQLHAQLAVCESLCAGSEIDPKHLDKALAARQVPVGKNLGAKSAKRQRALSKIRILRATISVEKPETFLHPNLPLSK